MRSIAILSLIVPALPAAGLDTSARSSGPDHILIRIRIDLDTQRCASLCLRLSDGRQTWSADTWLKANPDIDLVARRDSIERVDVRTGRRLWSAKQKVTIDEFILWPDAQCFSTKDIVLLPDRDGTLTALNAATGATAWVVTLPDESSVELVDGGMTFVRVPGGVITCLSNATGATRWSATTKLDGPALTRIGRDLIATSCNTGPVVSLDPASGAVRWSTDIRHPASDSQAHGGRFLVTGAAAITCLDLATGAIEWSLDGESLRCQGSVDGRVFLFDRANGRVVCVDEQTGIERWSAGIPGAENHAVHIQAGLIMATGSESTPLIAIDIATGKRAWEYAEARAYACLPASRHDAIFLVNRDRNLVKINLPSGAVAWVRHFDDEPKRIWPIGDRLVIMTKSEIARISPATGETIWSQARPEYFYADAEGR